MIAEKKLDTEARASLQEMCGGMFLDGECYAFAIAFHRLTGWQMVGLMMGNLIRHAAVRNPSGVLFDARGPVSEEKFGKLFGARPPYDLQEIEEKDLLDTRPIMEMNIRRASKWIESLWPDLPFVSGDRLRVRKFAEELEALSRKHGFWILGPYPATPPLLAEGPDEGEGGYVIRMTDEGNMFTINRFLNDVDLQWK